MGAIAAGRWYDAWFCWLELSASDRRAIAARLGDEFDVEVREGIARLDRDHDIHTALAALSLLNEVRGGKFEEEVARRTAVVDWEPGWEKEVPVGGVLMAMGNFSLGPALGYGYLRREAPPEMLLLGVNVRVRNPGEAKYPVRADSFAVESCSVTFRATTNSYRRNELRDTLVGPGGSAEGWLTFEVPVGLDARCQVGRLKYGSVTVALLWQRVDLWGPAPEVGGPPPHRR